MRYFKISTFLDKHHKLEEQKEMTPKLFYSQLADAYDFFDEPKIIHNDDTIWFQFVIDYENKEGLAFYIEK